MVSRLNSSPTCIASFPLQPVGKMEQNRRCLAQDRECSNVVLMLMRSLVYVAAAVFILWLPLGDPNSFDGKKAGLGAMCCLCDVYDMALISYTKTYEIIRFYMCLLKDTLYDAKLQFYSLLQKVDKKDLCRRACADEWEEEVTELEVERRRRRPLCRCIKKKCTRLA